jgi:hypothetical protein
MQKRIIKFMQVKEHHSGKALCNEFIDSIMDWNLDRKLIALTLDNASANDKCVEGVVGKLNQDIMPYCLFQQIYLVLLFISLCVSFGLRIKILCRIVLWQVSAFVTYPLRIRSVFISDDFRFQIRFRGFRFHFRFRHDRGKQKR